MDSKKNKVIFLFILLSTGFSPVKAIHPSLKSFVVPGTGEYQLGEKEKGRMFILSEAGLWTMFAGSVIVSKNIQNNYISFAIEYAGINPDINQDQYWIDLGNYSSMEEHNAEHLRFRDFDAIYPENKGWDWEWQSENKREKFRELRVKSDQWALTAQFIAGGIFLNHVVSAVDALYIHNVSQKNKIVVRPEFHAPNQYTGFQFSYKF